MKVTKCDYCGTETMSTADWLDLHRRSPSDRYTFVAKEELEFCSAKCVIEYLTKETA